MRRRSVRARFSGVRQGNAGITGFARHTHAAAYRRRMPTKTKTATKAVKATAQKAAKKVKPAVKKVVAKAKSSVKPVASKVSATAKTGKKKAGGLMQSVKHGVQAGIESVGDLVKKVAPAALLPKSAKPKRS